MKTEQFQKSDLKLRTKLFAIKIFHLIDSLPNKKSTNIIANQIGRSASSVGANYRAACRAKSSKDFINKLKIVEEEIDESQYWLEILEALGVEYKNEVTSLLQESKELTAIFVASIKTTKQNSISND